ncbi:MAG: hypothetical protein R3261_02485, partial [Alphaproteobacteria bacterium]|nr:hypothetical protein [Alphaproteobacteria bacterium]
KDENMAIPVPLPPNMPGLEATISRVGSIRPGREIELKNGGKICRWFEQIEAGDNEILRETVDGQPIVIRNGNIIYQAAWLNEDALRDLCRDLSKEAKLDWADMPEGLRRRQFNGGHMLINYNDYELGFGDYAIGAADMAMM